MPSTALHTTSVLYTIPTHHIFPRFFDIDVDLFCYDASAVSILCIDIVFLIRIALRLRTGLLSCNCCILSLFHPILQLCVSYYGQLIAGLLLRFSHFHAPQLATLLTLHVP